MSTCLQRRRKLFWRLLQKKKKTLIKKKKKNETRTFYKFFTRNQHISELFDSFITNLKELVKQSDFKSDKDRILKRRVVLGIQNIDVQERLLCENLSLEKTSQYCRVVEAAEMNRKELEQSKKQTKCGRWRIRQNVKLNVIIIILLYKY